MPQSTQTPLPTQTCAADVLKAFSRLPQADIKARQDFLARDKVLTKPPGSLGRLEALAQWVAEWQGGHPPRAERILTLIFAGNHGVVAQGVAAYPQAVTSQMVANFQSGGAAINQICIANSIELDVIPLELDTPTADFTQQPALDVEAFDRALTAGWNSVPDDIDLLCIGEMGIGNTTVAAALCAALFGGTAAQWVGSGTGVDAAGLLRKAGAVTRGLARHQKETTSPLEVLRHLGGRELAAMFSAIIAARIKRIPVLVDGYVASAAAAVAFATDPKSLDHCEIAHCSAEPPHRLLLQKLGKDPIVDLGMRLGEASGAALAAQLVRTAVRLHNGMATFESAGVSNKTD